MTLHIDELVLHGFARGDRYRIAEAMERELTRLLAERGAPPAWSGETHLESVNAGAFQVAAGARPDVIGGQIAGAVFHALSANGGQSE